jgi:hypothetical protein
MILGSVPTEAVITALPAVSPVAKPSPAVWLVMEATAVVSEDQVTGGVTGVVEPSVLTTTAVKSTV